MLHVIQRRQINTTICLCTKIVCFVSETCIDLIRSSSGPNAYNLQAFGIPQCNETQTTRICLLAGPEDDLVKSKHVALTKYAIFVYKQSVVLSTEVLYLYVITIRGGKHKKKESKEGRQCSVNLTMRRVHATIVAVEKQLVLHILSVCL